MRRTLILSVLVAGSLGVPGMAHAQTTPPSNTVAATVVTETTQVTKRTVATVEPKETEAVDDDDSDKTGLWGLLGLLGLFGLAGLAGRKRHDGDGDAAYRRGVSADTTPRGSSSGDTRSP